jgi:beta-fructofuranosidase
VWDATDLAAWRPLGPLLEADDPVAAEVAPAQIWECPNLVRVGARWVLLVSLWRWVEGSHLLAGVRWLVGDLEGEPDGLRFRPETGGVLDDGPAHYAPQVLPEGDRVLLWGWAWELDRSEAEVARAGWAGALTFPRELDLRGSTLLVRPAAELTGLRRGVVADQPGPPLLEPAFEVVARGAVRLLLHRAAGVQLVTEVGGTADEPARILVDGSLVEAFAGGRCWTGRAYPEPGSWWQVEGDRAEVVVHTLGLGGSGDR